MAKIRLTKEFRWEMAHALWNYDGLCKNIHGHSYILQVTVIGDPISDPSNVKLGMVMDFGDLKKIVNKVIVDVMDHSLVISEKSEHQPMLQLEEMFERRHITQYQPTCENMIADFAGRIIPLLPAGVALHSLRLYETATSWADWFAEDN